MNTAQPSVNTTEPSVLLTQDGNGNAYITLNRPQQRNPMDWTTIRELRSAVTCIEENPAVNVVIVRGSGGNFSAGGDLVGYVALYQNPPDFRAFLEDFYQLFHAIEASSKIYIAVVDGYCVAGGLELLLVCDIVIAARSAKIGDGHLNFGQLPGAGGSQRLPRAIGPMRARYLIATGELIDATEAERIGLVSKIIADADVDDFLAAFVTRLSNRSPLGLKGMKHLVNQGLRTDLESGLRLELEYVHNYATTAADASEGLVAFREKRVPRFSGS
jgi:enoyl-CoA hydratase